MKRRIGVSIYPDHSDYEADLSYLKKASDMGFSRVFMSMLEVSEGTQVVFNKFHRIITSAKQLGFEVMLDISPAVFDTLGISYDDLTFFSKVGADGIRLDLGFDGNKEALLSFNPFGLIIELNMSNNVMYLDNIHSHKANIPFIYGSHNFYPQDGTALPLSFFVECSERFKKYGIRTSAFVTSQTATIGPWDVNDGLPSLEMHRRLPVDVQVKHMFATGLIDDVVIGNAYASDAELEAVSRVNRYQLELLVETYENDALALEIMEHNQHVRRGDISDLVIRSTEVRKKYKGESNPSNHTDVFYRGDVLIGNDGFGKYKNELQIALQDHTDGRKNKVASVVAEEVFLLDYIDAWSKFKLKVK